MPPTPDPPVYLSRFHDLKLHLSTSPNTHARPGTTLTAALYLSHAEHLHTTLLSSTCTLHRESARRARNPVYEPSAPAAQAQPLGPAATLELPPHAVPAPRRLRPRPRPSPPGPRLAPFVFAAAPLAPPQRMAPAGTAAEGADEDSPEAAEVSVATARGRRERILHYRLDVPRDTPESVSFVEDANGDARVDVRLRLRAEIEVQVLERTDGGEVRPRVIRIIADNVVKVLPSCTAPSADLFSSLLMRRTTAAAAFLARDGCEGGASGMSFSSLGSIGIGRPMRAEGSVRLPRARSWDERMPVHSSTSVGISPLSLAVRGNDEDHPSPVGVHGEFGQGVREVAPEVSRRRKRRLSRLLWRPHRGPARGVTITSVVPEECPRIGEEMRVALELRAPALATTVRGKGLSSGECADAASPVRPTARLAVAHIVMEQTVRYVGRRPRCTRSISASALARLEPPAADSGSSDYVGHVTMVLRPTRRSAMYATTCSGPLTIAHQLRVSVTAGASSSAAPHHAHRVGNVTQSLPIVLVPGGADGDVYAAQNGRGTPRWAASLERRARRGCRGSVALFGKTEITNGDLCPVCLEDGGEMVRLPGCGHPGHVACLDDWMDRRRVCPICVADVKLPREKSSRVVAGMFCCNQHAVSSQGLRRVYC